jgi:hypothetical protein
MLVGLSVAVSTLLMRIAEVSQPAQPASGLSLAQSLYGLAIIVGSALAGPSAHLAGYAGLGAMGRRRHSLPSLARGSSRRWPCRTRDPAARQRARGRCQSASAVMTAAMPGSAALAGWLTNTLHAPRASTDLTGSGSRKRRPRRGR